MRERAPPSAAPVDHVDVASPLGEAARRKLLFDVEEKAFEVGAFGVEDGDRVVCSLPVAGKDSDFALGL